jgi:oligosaccharide repeat unit polymerase
MKNKWKRINTFKIYAICLLGVVVFYAVFIYLGTFTAKTSLENASEKIAIYSGGSIVALDRYLTDGHMHRSSIFGQETLINVYGLLSKIGFNAPTFSRHLEAISLGGYATNVYTSLRRYISDYGYLGMILMQILLGVFFGGFYMKIKSLKTPSILMLIYSYLFYALIMQGIDEILMSNMLNYVTVYRICVMLGVSCFFSRRGT